MYQRALSRYLIVECINFLFSDFVSSTVSKVLTYFDTFPINFRVNIKRERVLYSVDSSPNNRGGKTRESRKIARGSLILFPEATRRTKPTNCPPLFT